MALSKHWLIHFFDRNDSHSVDYNRRLYTFLAFSYFGCIALIIFSYKNYSSDYAPVFIITSVTASIFFVNLLYFHLYKNLDLSCKIASVGIIIFCLILVYQGGIENTALYWVFPLSLLLFGLLGYFYGCIANCVVFISLLIMLTHPELLLANYSASEVVRFLSSFFVLNIMGFINEYLHENSHSTMADINFYKNQQANTDALTNLPNRRFVDVVFFPSIKVNVNDRFPMVLIMADVDGFKVFNDTYGHHVGDIILKKLARTMEECIRTEDIVTRVGGEEFLLLFSNTGYEIGLKIAEKMRKEVSAIDLVHEHQILKVTMSFGVAISHNYSEIESKLKEADVKLYQAKNAGRNCIR